MSTFTIPITHGWQIKFKSSIFQAHAAPVQSEQEAESVLKELKSMNPWDLSNCICYAYRLNIKKEEEDDEEEEGDDEEILEICSGKDEPVAEKLKTIVIDWDVVNVIVIVTRWDESIMTSVRLGCQRFAIAVDRVKAVLEQCYLESLNVDIPDSIKTTDQKIEKWVDVKESLELKNRNRKLERQHEVKEQSFKGFNFKGKKNKNKRNRIIDEDIKVNANILGKMNIQTIDSTTVEWPFNHGRKKMIKGRINHFLQEEEKIDDSKVALMKEIEEKESKDEFAEDDDKDDSDSIHLISSSPLTRRVIDEIKSLRVPPPSLHRVFQALAVLLFMNDLSWYGCLDMISNQFFNKEMKRLRRGDISKEEIVMARYIIYEGELVMDRVRKQSTHAAKLLHWLNEVLSKAESKNKILSTKL